MSVGILNTALSGLAAFQRSLETTSNNISNVNTEGYSRQRAELATSPEQYTGHGYVGTGVNVANITRSYDQFISNQVRTSTSTYNEVDSFYTLSAQIDNITADENTGLAPTIKEFFNAVNDVANDPTAISARQVLLTQADTLAHQFNTLDARLDTLREQVNTNIDTAVKDVNGYIKAIADLNVKIVTDIGRSSGRHLPNELLDQRDQLLNKVAEKMDVSVIPQQDGSVSIFAGQGQMLVQNDYAATLSVQSASSDLDHKQIMLNGQDITHLLSGGEIYGNVRFRDQVLDPAQRQLGLLATGLATEFNNVHTGGTDLNNNPGLEFFKLDSPPPTVQVLSTTRNPVTVAASFVKPTSALNLGASYRLEVTSTGPDTFKLTNLTDNSVTAGLSAVDLLAPNPATAAANGFNISFVGGTLNVGDSFQISPSFNAAEVIKLNPAITSAKQIAAANSLNAPGDNRNALKLAELESKTPMLGGKSSFTQVYGQLVADVGAKTHEAQVSRSAQDVLLKQATGARENLAGVNLDEEAANLIKFQNSYQAAAKAVSVASTLFDTLIGAVR